MPFDSSFTTEEFEAAITTDPKILERVTPVLTKKDYVVRDKTANTTYEDGLKQKHLSEFNTTIATSTEKEIFDLTGIKKTDGESWNKYNARALKALKDGADSKETELSTLRGKSDVSAAERARMTELEQSINTLNTNHAKEKATWGQQLTAAEAKSTISLDLASLRPGYLKTIPASVTKMAEEAAIAAIMPAAKMEQGKLVFLNADGTIERDQTTMLPVTAADKLQAALKDILDPGHQVKGAGSSNREGGEGGALPEGVTTKVQLMNYLLNVKKMIQDSEEITKEFVRMGGNSLPLQ